MHLVLARVVDQGCLERRGEEQKIAPPILQLAQQTHLARVIDHEVVKASFRGFVAVFHDEMDYVTTVLGLVIEFQNICDAVVQLF